MQIRTGTKILGASGTAYVVESFVDFGGQAEIFRAVPEPGDGKAVALKVFREEWLHSDPQIMNRVRELIEARYHESLGLTEFVWPRDEIVSGGISGFAMEFVPANYLSLDRILEEETCEFRASVLSRRVSTRIAALLADAMNRLHSEGIAYRDLNARNVLVDPKDVTITYILDTEHSISNRQPVNIAGPASYRAPELWRSDYPNSATDRHSLAVIFFKLLFFTHPLGAIPADEIETSLTQRRHYADEALFIFDPHDDRNRLRPGEADYQLQLWNTLPEHARALFTRTFTEGLRQPGRRVLENDWLPAFVRLHNAIVTCAACATENFTDPREAAHPCFACGGPLPRRWRLESREHSIVLEPGVTLYRWQFDWENERGRSTRAALVVQRETPLADGSRPIGLKNLGAAPWRALRVGASESGEPETIAPGKILQLGGFTHVAFAESDAFAALVAPSGEKVQA